MADLYDMSDEELEAAFQAAKEAGDDDSASDEVVDDVADGQDEVVDDEEEVDYDDEDTGDDEDLEEDSDDDGDDIDEGEDDDVENEDDEVEQPDDNEDSDDDESTDEDGEDEAGKDSDEEVTDEAKKEPEEEVQPAHYKFKANGKDYEFTPDEIMDQFPKIFGQAMDYTKKTQAMKPWRKTIDAIETAKLSHDDINLAIDVLNGDQGAIQEVLKRQGIDAIDLNTEEDSKYVPNDYGRDEAALNLQDVINDINADPEYSVTQKVLSQEWDDQSWETMAKDPQLIKLLHTDVKSGVFQELQPIAEKMKVFDGNRQSDLDYYKQAAIQKAQENQMAQERASQAQVQERTLEAERSVRDADEAKRREVAEVKAKQAKAKQTKSDASKRKAAAPVRKTTGVKKATDYLDDNDEAFDEWYANLQDQ